MTPDAAKGPFSTIFDFFFVKPVPVAHMDTAPDTWGRNGFVIHDKGIPSRS